MTYDSKINFYNCNSLLAQPQQMTVGDVDDMFVPLAEGLMVDVDKSEAVIDSLLTAIPAMFSETRETETMLGPVIQAGKEAFKAAGMAGKLVVFHHNLPVAPAPGQLKNRDDRKCLGTDKEKTVLTPQTKFYNDLGQECVGVGCSVDLFLFNNAYIDIATVSQVRIVYKMIEDLHTNHVGLSVDGWAGLQVYIFPSRFGWGKIYIRSRS